MKVTLLYENINPIYPDNLNWFTIRVEDVPRLLIVEWNRHRTISTTQKSSRFTLNEIKGKSQELIEAKDLNDEIYGKYLYLTGNPTIDWYAHQNLARTANLLELGCKIDEVKTTLPEGFLMNGVWTMTIEAWNHLYNLRSAKGAIKPFRRLVELIKEQIEPLTERTDDTKHTPLSVCSFAIRECYNSHDKSDNGGSKDKSLIKRVGVAYKHSSTLEVLRFRAVITREDFNTIRHLKYIEYYFVDNDTIVVLFNMRIIVENDWLLRLINIPEEYKYLLKGE